MDKYDGNKKKNGKENTGSSPRLHQMTFHLIKTMLFVNERQYHGVTHTSMAFTFLPPALGSEPRLHIQHECAQTARVRTLHDIPQYCQSGKILFNTNTTLTNISTR